MNDIHPFVQALHVLKDDHTYICLPLFSPSAGPKANEEQKRLAVHYRSSQHYQENVFIEGSRPQYLEDLHTEAQEGLKILQQEGQTPQYEC